MSVYALRKAGRLNSKVLIGEIFEGGHSEPFSIFPIRVVHMPVEQDGVSATMPISVSKRRLKRAIKRNQVKRQIHRVYRKNKQPLPDGL